MIKKIQVIVENEFTTSDKNSTELGVTVFERAFRKLTHEKSSTGKIFPVYLKINGIDYTFGVFTLNNSGSTSLFLELPEGTFFDHITFGKNLIKNKTHLTYIDNNAHKKVTSIEPALLPNGTYHVLTLIIDDANILKPAPKKILYPIIDIDQKKLLEEALITRGSYNGSGRLEAVGDTGIIIVQVFLIPKGIDCKTINFTKSGLGPLSDKFDEKNLENTQISMAYLGHEFQDEYQFGLIILRYQAKIDGPLYLSFGINESGHYFNSPDDDLNKSVRDNLTLKRFR